MDGGVRGERGDVGRPDVVACGWCGREVVVAVRGRVPRWCGSGCRHRAWEQRRAAGAVSPLASQAPASVAPTGPEWPGLLAELSRQLDTGRVEVCDLPAITAELDAASAAINRYLLF